MATGTSLQEPGYWPWPDLLANALVLDGQLDAAEAFLRPHEQRAKARGHRSAQARLGYARGRLHGALGDIHAARRSFEASLELLNGLPLRYDTARVNFAYGQTLRRAGKRRQADVVIGTARELYLSLGAHDLCRPMRSRAQGRWAAPGPWLARRRRPHATGRSGLDACRPRSFES